MKIVQTFWHGNNSLLDNSFGWMNPQYHLMSWALSCLSLKDNYQNIVLYTDSHGYEIFAEQLKLPYTDIIIQYDNLTSLGISQVINLFTPKRTLHTCRRRCIFA